MKVKVKEIFDSTLSAYHHQIGTVIKEPLTKYDPYEVLMEDEYVLYLYGYEFEVDQNV